MRRTSRLIAATAAFAILAAACGDDKASNDSTSVAPVTTAAATATTAATTETTGATDTTVATTETTAAVDTTVAAAETTAPAPATDLDAENGKGAAAWNALLDKADNAPQVAEGDPILIAMPNLEGDAGGSFPEIREGAEAAVKFINEKLGGVGATADAPGRPIKLEVCVHGLTPDAAIACANKIKESDPALIINGIDFFTPAFYPIFAGIPTMETVPIFVDDFNTPGVVSAFGGCVSAFPAGALFLSKDYFNADKIAVIYSDNAPGQQCYADTQKRFYDFLGINNIGVPDAPGDPADNDANAQKIVDELKDATNPAVYFGIQASDCAEYIKALNKAGFTGQIVASGSCNDQSVLDLPETTGVIFEQQSYIEEQPTLYNEFVQREIASRKAAFDAYGPKSPGSAFLRTSFAAVVFAFQVMEDVIAAGGDPTDHATLQAALLAVNDQHIVGHPPISCGDNAPQFISVCKKSNTFTTWDGTTFVPYPGLEGKYLDLTQLLTDIPPRA